MCITITRHKEHFQDWGMNVSNIEGEKLALLTLRNCHKKSGVKTFLSKMPNMFLPSTAHSFQPDSLDNPPLLVSFPLPTQPFQQLMWPYLWQRWEPCFAKHFAKVFFPKWYFIFLIFQPHYPWGWGLFLSWDYYRLSHILWQSEVLHYGLVFFSPVMDFNHSLALSKLLSRYTN